MAHSTHRRLQPQPQLAAEWADLPERIRALLQAEGLDSAGAWRAAGKRRSEIFGVPASMRRMLDRIARGAS